MFYHRVDRLEAIPPRATPILQALALSEMGDLVLADYEQISGRNGSSTLVRKVRVGRLISLHLLIGDDLAFMLPTAGYVQYRFETEIASDAFHLRPSPLSELLDETNGSGIQRKEFRLVASGLSVDAPPDLDHMRVWFGTDQVLTWLKCNLQPQKMTGILRHLQHPSF